MQHPQTAPALLRMTLAAALLMAPGLALSQAPPAPGQSPSGMQPSPTRPMNPATDPTAPTRIAPAPAMPAVTLNPPVTGALANAPPGAMTGSVMAARPRMSQIISSRIYNDRDQNVGEVDDVLLTANGPMAIVQVGGFLGIGGRLVQMPLSELRWNAERERLMLPGSTKEMLEARPAFEYDAAHRRR